MVTFYLIFLNVPDRSPLEEDIGTSWFDYSLAGYCVSAFLLGFGDSCFNTQIYSILGTVFSKDGAPAFALYKVRKYQLNARPFCSMIVAHFQPVFFTPINVSFFFSFMGVSDTFCSKFVAAKSSLLYRSD